MTGELIDRATGHGNHVTLRACEYVKAGREKTPTAGKPDDEPKDHVNYLPLWGHHFIPKLNEYHDFNSKI